MKKIILLTNKYPKAPYDIVASALPDGFELMMLTENSQEAMEEAVSRADYILASGRVKITRRVLDNAPNLKMIQRTGVGLDSLDLAEIKKRKIPLYVNPGINSQSVAEHTLLLMLACLRRLPVFHRNTANGIWKRQEQGVMTSELAGKTIGLIGMGNIAQKVAALLRGFGVTILYYDPFRKKAEEESRLGIIYCGYEEVMLKADILSLHCPLTEQTRKLIDTAVISRMKDGVILINTARGGLVDTEALTAALESGKIGFAGLDVYEDEPLKRESALTKLENVILTPHIGGITFDSFQGMMAAAMRNIEKYENGELDEISQFLYDKEGDY